MLHDRFCAERLLGDLLSLDETKQTVIIEDLVADGILCQIDVLDAGFFIEDAIADGGFEADRVFEKTTFDIVQLLKQIVVVAIAA